MQSGRFVHGTASPRARARLNEILEKLPMELLDALEAYGLRIEFTRDPQFSVERGVSKRAGLFDSATRTATFDEAILRTPQATQFVLHEIAHALDHMKGLRMGRTGDTHSSTQDAGLQRLLQNYRDRVAVQDAAELQKGRESEVQFGFSLLKVGRHSSKVSMQPIDGSLGDGMSLKGTLILAAASAGLLFVAAPIGALGLGLAGLNAVALVGSAIKQSLQPSQRTQVEVGPGQMATVHRQGPVTTVEFPRQAAVQPARWSDYACYKATEPEYMAEGLSHYLASDKSREQLRRMDPGMHQWVADFLAAEVAAWPSQHYVLHPGS